MTTALNYADLMALSPLLMVLFGALVVLLLESFVSSPLSKKLTYFATLLTLGAAVAFSFVQGATENPSLTSWIRFDSLANFFTLFFLTIGIACTLLAHSFFKHFETTVGEFYFLLLSAVFGLLLIGISADFLILFIGLETLSISLYILCGYIKRWKISYEAALKYFFIGALGTAFLLYGIA